MIKDMIVFLLGDGLTQVQLSQQTGIPQSAISRLINGEQHDIGYRKGKRLESMYLARRQNSKKAA